MAAAEKLASEVRAGHRRALAQAITLIESTRADHRNEALVLLEKLTPFTGNSIRIGISGPPGVGKSTFIETFGLNVISQQCAANATSGMVARSTSDDDPEASLSSLASASGSHCTRVAVLSVDPSSALSGGSILGDKTRMENLSRHEAAFIRPSPSAGTLGGVARRTREALLLCEAAGFDVVIVETVGVGQSETAVADMVDIFVLLVSPSAGDDLQGIKRGIMELADLVLVNKADGDLLPAARRAAADCRLALGLTQPRSKFWRPSVELTSGLTGEGIARVWELVQEHQTALTASGELTRRRAAQARTWLWNEVTENLMLMLRENPEIRKQLPGLEAEVMAGRMSPTAAAQQLLRSVKVV